MPKLNKQTAKKVEDAKEWGNFAAVPEGRYTLLLKDVEVKEGREFPYWAWTFEIVSPEEFQSQQQWLNTSLSPKALGRLKQVFSAFGVPGDTDTDELCGKTVDAYIVQRVIQEGNRQGEMGNDITNVFSSDTANEAAGTGGPGEFDEEF